MHRYLPLAFLLVATSVTTAQNGAPLRIATYNLLNFPGPSGASRIGSFRTVVGALRPHLLVAQEVLDAQGVTLFRDQVLNPAMGGGWSAAPFVDAGTDTENAFFYDTSRIELLGTEFVTTSLRAIAGYRFAVKGTRDTAWIYSLHLKAAQEDSEQRREEAAMLRQHLDTARSGEWFIVAGDFNTYGASEPAYQLLLAEGADSQTRLIDPLSSVAEWHNNRTYAGLHTQSPRVRQFQGGSNGGMDDRFDMILVSPGISPVIVRSSYAAFGNDGLHFNDSLNRRPNAAVEDSVAQAIHDASDHLPVYADFVFGDAARTPAGDVSISVVAQPNPSRDVVTFTTSGIIRGLVTVRDQRGRVVAEIPFDERNTTVRWNATTTPSGVYAYSVAGIRGTVVVLH
jgi:endonuclease/exonuclease/phosphatase family metal-dependent hydrolase